jgi:hypothetical protein
MPGDGLTHGPPATKKQAAVTTGSAGSTGIPCAMVLTVSFGLSPVTMLGCHRQPQDAGSVFMTLAPASERQDHTTSPSACATFVSRAVRVHRIPAPRIVTIAMRPSSSRRDAREHRCDLPDAASTDACGRLARRAVRAWGVCGNCHRLNRCMNPARPLQQRH